MSSPLHFTENERRRYEAIVEKGRWTVDNSESRIASRLIPESPRKSILKGWQTPETHRTSIYDRQKRRRELIERRRVSFAPDARVRLFGRNDSLLTSPQKRTNMTDDRPDSSVFDDPSEQNVSTHDNPFLARLTGSPIDRKRRRSVLLGSPTPDVRSPQHHFTRIREDPFNAFDFHYRSNSNDAIEFPNNPTGNSPQSRKSYYPNEHDAVMNFLNRLDRTDSRTSPVVDKQLHGRVDAVDLHLSPQPQNMQTQHTANVTGAGSHDGDTMQLTQMLQQEEDGGDTMQLTQIIQNHDSIEAPMEFSQALREENHDDEEPMQLTQVIVSPDIRVANNVSLNRTPRRRLSSLSFGRDSTADHSIGSDYGDRMVSMHGNENVNILEEEYPHLSNSFLDDNTITQNISLSDFLQYVGITFKENITVKNRRRTSGFNQSRGASTMLEQATTAACIMPELDMYKTRCEELVELIDADHKALKAIDKEVSEKNPQFFAEYLEANVQLRSQLEERFRLIRKYAQAGTRRLWYEYRSSFTEELNDLLKEKIQKFDEDKQFLRMMENELRRQLPYLSAYKDGLKKSLEEARKREEEYHQIDQEQLASLEAEIEEQKIILEGFKEDTKSLEQEENELSQRKTEMEHLKDEAAAAIDRANKTIAENQYATIDDLVNAKQQFAACCALGQWRLLQNDETMTNVMIDNDLQVTIASLKLKQQEEGAVNIRVVETEDEGVGLLAELAHGLNTLVSDAIPQSEMLQKMAIYWNRVKMIHREILRAQRRFWVELTKLTENEDTDPGDHGVQCDITLLSYLNSTKFSFSLQIRPKDVMAFPKLITDGLRVRLDYGHIKEEELEALIAMELRENGIIDFVDSLRNVIEKIQ
ncbi:Spc7 kinetochore protein-domain-containing protein [Radiomyces spectabilis]|uniref:Spc7 kinetochore protein-domain-containing protein n=1 Tax=Radiomyces spectabilis TaxID=64574 RepID=UPI00222063F3|nr:Spc7 kinetochore protein-domain-containing protein [Radiomyces spectabilis]KAI8376568.1 Spc7 kinetochore protein-domain-containing protein [Radiomyces spectabilis]